MTAPTTATDSATTGYDARAVANWFLDRADRDGRRLNHEQLQKMVYLAHGWHLARLERPLVRDAVEAWPYGPILPVLYQEFKQFGDGPITGRAFEFDFDRGENRNLTADLPAATEHLLELAWESYRDEPGPDLNALASAPGSPWDEVIRDRNGAPAARRTAIPNDHLRRYYDERRRRILAGEA